MDFIFHSISSTAEEHPGVNSHLTVLFCTEILSQAYGEITELERGSGLKKKDLKTWEMIP